MEWRYTLLRVIVVYGTSSLLVGGGVYAAVQTGRHGTFVERMCHFDGAHYIDIAEHGYSYTPDIQSNVAFFPAFPLMMRWVAWELGIHAATAGVVITNTMLLVYLVLLDRYVIARIVRNRSSAAAPDLTGEGETVLFATKLLWRSLFLAALIPTAFFLRMCYTESLFVATLVGFALLIEKRVSPWFVSLSCGLLTAIRPVGVAAVPAAIWYAWKHSPRPKWVGPLICCVLSSWGLLGYMAYQWIAFGEGLAFIKTQAHWRLVPAIGMLDKTVSLLSFEPLWSTYIPDTMFYWRRDWGLPIWVSLQAANPVYFVATAGLVLWGGKRGYLRDYEMVLSSVLIMIPYVARSYEMAFNSQGRFCLVVFSVYPVASRIMADAPWQLVWLVFALLAVYVSVYAYEFASGAAFF